MTREQDLLQVAMVRLRLEGVPHKLVTRQEIVLAGLEPRSAHEKIRDRPRTGWPFPGHEHCIVLCRVSLANAERVETYKILGHVQTAYILSDGVERDLEKAHGYELYAIALATRNVPPSPWMSSGWVQ